MLPGRHLVATGRFDRRDGWSVGRQALVERPPAHDGGGGAAQAQGVEGLDQPALGPCPPGEEQVGHAVEQHQRADVGQPPPGLVQPQRRNNLRLYSEADIKRVRIIRFLTRTQRVNLAGVRVILQLEALGKIRVYDLFDEDDVERFADQTPEADESDEPELVEGATRRGN